ncbi:hypothetical protein PHLCEN_2v609, partial [Hermanssonia centrifuga]
MPTTLYTQLGVAPLADLQHLTPATSISTLNGRTSSQLHEVIIMNDIPIDSPEDEGILVTALRNSHSKKQTYAQATEALHG